MIYQSLTIFVCVVVSISIEIAKCSPDELRGPPKVETQINLLDSYIPAAMQVIAHLTESMKYDLKPAIAPTSTTSRPTSSPGVSSKPTSTHKPGVYAPEKPPVRYQKLGEARLYGKNVQHSVDFDTKDDNMFLYANHDPSRTLARVETAVHVQNEELPENLENLIGDVPANLIKFINSQFIPPPIEDPHEQVQIFSQNYDDSDFRAYLEGHKKTPPTRAYVTLLSLYDMMSKDAKKQGFNRFQGYHKHVLDELVKTSEGTSVEQLRYVLEKILKNQDTKQPELKKKIETLLDDMKKDNSYIHQALLYVPPLQYTV